MNAYPHRMSRRGYANLENDWVSDKEIEYEFLHDYVPSIWIDNIFLTF